MQIKTFYSHVPIAHYLRDTLAFTGERQQEGQRWRARRLTVLDGAAMVSISSWVTQTLPDGYEEGAEPKRQSSSSSSSGVGSTGPVGGASSVKEEEQHHCKPIVLKHHSQITNWPSELPAGGQRAHAEDGKIKHTQHSGKHTVVAERTDTDEGTPMHHTRRV